MTAQEWLEAFAEGIGIDAPDEETTGELLELAATAAHNSERIAAPIACYMLGVSGKSVEEGRKAAEAI